MTDTVEIIASAPANKGQDYAYLKTEGTELVQQLSGAIWTDYNEHDPGVTTLEQLCYALTELSYRAEFPLKDLLIDPKKRRIVTKKQALFIPKRILPCNPVTENDYRKLIVDRVPEVENVWLIPYRPADDPKYVNGLYEIWLYAPGVDECACDEALKPEVIKHRVRRVYCRHRNLCEDIQSIKLFNLLQTTVYCDVGISDECAADGILANIFFNVGNFLAPELRRWSLKSQIDEGKTPDEIFNGPLLRNGFIEDKDLKPKATEVRVQDIVRVIANCIAVLSVRNTSVRIKDDPKVYKSNDSIKVPLEDVLELNTKQIGTPPAFSIRLYKNGIECKPDPARVQRELDKLWSDYRRTQKLSQQYEEFFAVPQGRFRDVRRYYSIQNQYPNIYGINSFGLPEHATAARKGQAKQFKGYLLVFEQLLADYFAQLQQTKHLYSTEPLKRTYFFQYLNKSVPNVCPLLKNCYEKPDGRCECRERGTDGSIGYRLGLPLLVHSEDQFVDRRNRFLDFLLALYAQRIDPDAMPKLECCSQSQGPGEDLIDSKIALLQRLVASTHSRGRGFDYLAPPSQYNIAGMEIKCRIQLGIGGQRSLTEALGDLGIDLVKDDKATSVGRAVVNRNEEIEENFISVATYEPDTDSPAETTSPSNTSSILRTQLVNQGFLDATADIDNFRMGIFSGDRGISLVCKAPGQDDWRLIGKYDDYRSAQDAAFALTSQTQVVIRHSRQLYIVEHTLMRPRPIDDVNDVNDNNAPAKDAQLKNNQPQSDADADKDPFVYSFTITAVLCYPTKVTEDYKKKVREIVRENTPAHIVDEYCFLGPLQALEFDALYLRWRQALRRGFPRPINAISADLRRFLTKCSRRTGSDSESDS